MTMMMMMVVTMIEDGDNDGDYNYGCSDDYNYADYNKTKNFQTIKLSNKTLVRKFICLKYFSV